MEALIYAPRLVLALALTCATACSNRTSDPLSVTRDPGPLELVAVRIVAAEAVRAEPKGVNLNTIAPAVQPRPDPLFVYRIEHRRGWVRLAFDQSSLRLVLWVPEAEVEFVNPDTLEFVTFDMGPLSTHGSWVELERGTPILDAPEGAPFGVALHDTSLPWLRDTPEDGAVEVMVSTSWGYLRGFIECPCVTVANVEG